MTSAERTAERTFYATRRRNDLIRLLAPDCRCAICLLVFDVGELEVDHMNGRLWLVGEVSSHIRVARYWREYKAGIPMQALCRTCSARGGGRRYNGERPSPRRRNRDHAAVAT